MTDSLLTIAIVGNPNVGKTELFNALTGKSSITGNYPGVTVERKHGRMRLGDREADLIDLPGTYSLAARSPDEMIVVDVLLNQQPGEKPIDAVLVVVDASNLERNLYLVSQLQEIGLPLVIALNMMDVAHRRGLKLDCERLSKTMGGPVVPLCAHKRKGIAELRVALDAVTRKEYRAALFPATLPDAVNEQLVKLENYLHTNEKRLGRRIQRPEVLRVLIDANGYAQQRLWKRLGPGFGEHLEAYRHASRNGVTLPAMEARARYSWAREVVAAGVNRPGVRVVTRSERIDHILTHRVFGTVIFAALMMVVFQAIYTWAGPVMGLIDSTFAGLGALVSNVLPEGVLQSLVVDGIIAGVGSVIIFLPQILILTLFVALLEDCGYMARAAFLMDKLFSWCGLSGQSFIPMLSSFACAIPGIMATRTIHERRDRFATILVAPLMSCSARLPIYVVIIGAFIPATPVVGDALDLQGVTLFLMYFLGIATAIPVAFVLKRTIFRGDRPPFLLELPSYKVPQPRTVLLKVYNQGSEFLKRAGTVIFAIAVIVWALAYFPHTPRVAEEFAIERAALVAELGGPQLELALGALSEAEQSAYLKQSFLGRAGHFVEPVVQPLGWDWRIGTAAIASFPAREISLATLGTLFNLGQAEDASQSLHEALISAKRPDGSRLFTIPVALSVMVFFALCCQCGATLVTIKRETAAWRWPLLAFTYMSVLAYVGAFVVYHVGTAMGLGGG
jgi:ferrous iron transport protein B